MTPAKTRYVDVGLQKDGHGLALSVPEALWTTNDSGASWKKLDVPPSGAYGLLQDKDGEAVVQTALGVMKWDGKGLIRLSRTPTRHRFQLTKRPPRGPDASALAEGRAIVLDGRYLEVAKAEGKGKNGWVLWQGPADGAIQEAPLLVAKDCRALRLAGFDKELALACSRRNVGSTQEIDLYLSHDGGKKWLREGYDVIGRMNQLGLAVGADGALVVSGICPPFSRSRGCSSYGVYARRKIPPDAGANPKEALAEAAKVAREKKPDRDEPQSEGFELTLSATPALTGYAAAVAFSLDGRTAYAVGKRSKTGAYAVYVSRDRGLSFEAHEVSQIEATQNFEESGMFARPPSGSGAQVVSLSPGDDGTVAIVFRNGNGWTLAITDQDGNLVQLSEPPHDINLLGAVGSRALAISTGVASAWESLDGGATWEPIGRLPLRLCRGSSRCSEQVSCHPAGCVIGNELSRLGWRGEADDDQGVLAPPDRPARDLFDRKVRTAFSCTLEEGAWKPLSGVSRAPTADQAAIGKVAWYSVVRDGNHASARVLHGVGGQHPQVSSVELIPPAKNPQEHALMVSTQVEGGAALRYPTPEASGKARIANVEVAWDNLLEGKVVRARILDAGPYVPGDYSREGAGAQFASPDLISIGEGGLYLRVHRSSHDDQVTYFVDGKSVATVPPIQWPYSSLSGRRAEMARIGGTHVPLAIFDNGAVVVRARREGAAWAFDAYSTGLTAPAAFGLTQVRDIAYDKKRSGLQLMIFDADGPAESALLYPFNTHGPAVDKPIAIPTQRNTGSQPKRCGAVTKTDTPRVVVPYSGGTRHPIIVSDPTEPMRVLLTSHAVMHGTPKEPCVAAFDAEGLVLDASDQSPRWDRAILLLDDLEHSWMFRSSDEGDTIQYRSMSCRFDPSAEVPFEVYGAAGTLVQRGQ